MSPSPAHTPAGRVLACRGMCISAILVRRGCNANAMSKVALGLGQRSLEGKANSEVGNESNVSSGQYVYLGHEDNAGNHSCSAAQIDQSHNIITRVPRGIVILPTAPRCCQEAYQPVVNGTTVPTSLIRRAHVPPFFRISFLPSTQGARDDKYGNRDHRCTQLTCDH